MLGSMAWTQADIDALEAAMASGEMTVRSPDGRLVTYQSLDDMLKLRAAMREEVAATTRTLKGVRHQTAVFCDDC